MKISKSNSLSIQIQKLAVSGLLCALGILIPTFAPKIVLEPASYTLASHVPVFIAIFISPVIAVSVAICTGIGFFFSTTPVIALRALSHVGFALVGSLLLKNKPQILKNAAASVSFNFLLAVIHAICEVLVVTLFYFGNQASSLYYQSGYLKSVVLLVGLGTIVHSMIDFTIARFVWKPVTHVLRIPVSAK